MYVNKFALSIHNGKLMKKTYRKCESKTETSRTSRNDETDDPLFCSTYAKVSFLEIIYYDGRR